MFIDSSDSRESGAVVARLTPVRKVGGSNPAAAKTVTREEIHSR